MEKYARNFLWLVLIPGLAYCQMATGIWLRSTGLAFGEYLAIASYVTFFLPFALRLGWARGLLFCFFYAILAHVLGMVTMAPLMALTKSTLSPMLIIPLWFIGWTWAMTALGGRILEHESAKRLKNVSGSPDLKIIGTLSVVGFISLELSDYLSGNWLTIIPILWIGLAILGVWKIGMKGIISVFGIVFWSGLLVWIFGLGGLGELMMGLLASMRIYARIGEIPSLIATSLAVVHWSIIVSERCTETKCADTVNAKV